MPSSLVIGTLMHGFTVKAFMYAAFSFVVSSLAKPSAPDPVKDPGVSQRLAADTNNKLPVLYGKKRLRGIMTYAAISDDNKKMAYIISLCEGPIHEISDIYWDNYRLTLDEDGIVTNATNYEDEDNNFLNGNMKVVNYLSGGRCSDMESFDADWESDGVNRTMPDVAYVYIELTYDRDKGVTSLASNLGFDCSGKKVRSFTTNLSGETVFDSTYSYSTNPALCLADYMNNSVYGANIPEELIDFDSLVEYRDFCNELKSYNNGEDSAKRYTCNGTISTSSDIDMNINNLLIGTSSHLSYSLGKFGVIIDRVTTTVNNGSFDEDSIVGSINISLTGFDTKLNNVTVKYDNASDYYRGDQIILSSPASIKNDNEPELESTYDLPFTNNNIEAERSGTIILNQSRQSLAVSFSTDISRSHLQAGDVIEVTHNTPGWISKKFRINKIEEQEVAGTGGLLGLKIEAREYADEVYDDLELNLKDPAPNTNLPDPYRKPNILDASYTPGYFIGGARGLVEWESDTADISSYNIEVLGAEYIPENYRELTLGTVSNPFDAVYGKNYQNLENKMTIGVKIPEHMTQTEWDNIMVGEKCVVAGSSDSEVESVVFSVHSKLEPNLYPSFAGADKILRINIGQSDTSWITGANLSGDNVKLHIGANSKDTSGYAGVEYAQTFSVRENTAYLNHLEAGEYLVRITPVNRLGVLGNTFDMNVSVPPPPVPDRVSGLEIDLGEDGEANSTEWTGRDVKIKWRKGTASWPAEVENDSLEFYASSDNHIKEYMIWVYNPSGYVIRRDYVTDTFYTYTYEKNAEDAAKNGDTPYRTLTFKVKAKSVNNVLSERWATL